MPAMEAVDESFDTGIEGAGQGAWAPSTWATVFFVAALLWLIFVVGAFSERG